MAKLEVFKMGYWAAKNERGHFDRRDGIAVNCINTNDLVSKEVMQFNLWDCDAYFTTVGNGLFRVGIARCLNAVNKRKPRLINGYKNKINGRE